MITSNQQLFIMALRHQCHQGIVHSTSRSRPRDRCCSCSTNCNKKAASSLLCGYCMRLLFGLEDLGLLDMWLSIRGLVVEI
jgi:hypothetical protein